MANVQCSEKHANLKGLMLMALMPVTLPFVFSQGTSKLKLRTSEDTSICGFSKANFPFICLLV